jgi:hypothetical protein
MAGHRRQLIFGAVAGAVLVAILAALFGTLVRDLVHPAAVVAFALLGAILGAYAGGALAYDRERVSADPDAGYRTGILAEREPDELPAGPRI